MGVPCGRPIGMEDRQLMPFYLSLQGNRAPTRGAPAVGGIVVWTFADIRFILLFAIIQAAAKNVRKVYSRTEAAEMARKT